jgi:hypothetical protein
LDPPPVLMGEGHECGHVLGGLGMIASNFDI